MKIPRDVFRRALDLPNDRERVVVRHRGRSYRLNDEDVRALSTIGAFRVVAEEDLVRPAADEARTREDEDRVNRLRDAGLVETVAIDGGDQRAVALTSEGRELLEASRLERRGEPRQRRRWSSSPEAPVPAPGAAGGRGVRCAWFRAE